MLCYLSYSPTIEYQTTAARANRANRAKSANANRPRNIKQPNLQATSKRKQSPATNHKEWSWRNTTPHDPYQEPTPACDKESDQGHPQKSAQHSIRNQQTEKN